MSSMLSGSRRLVGSLPRAGVSWPHRGPHCTDPFPREVLSFLTRVRGQYRFGGGAGAVGAAPRGLQLVAAASGSAGLWRPVPLPTSAPLATARRCQSGDSRHSR